MKTNLLRCAFFVSIVSFCSGVCAVEETLCSKNIDFCEDIESSALHSALMRALGNDYMGVRLKTDHFIEKNRDNILTLSDVIKEVFETRVFYAPETDKKTTVYYIKQKEDLGDSDVQCIKDFIQKNSTNNLYYKANGKKCVKLVLND